MLLNIITDTIAPHSEFDIVGTCRRTANLLETAEETDADIVIVARNGAADDDDYDELLYRRGRVKVIEIVDEGRYGSLYELQRRHVPLGEMSPPRLVDVIRKSVERTARADS